MSRSRSNPFRTPPKSYDYGPVIEALALCCEAEAVIHDIDALAKLLPDEAESRIRSNRQLHSTR